MSDKKIIDHMVSYIEEKERQLQAEKMSGDNQAKNDIVKSILDELDTEVSNENK